MNHDVHHRAEGALASAKTRAIDFLLSRRNRLGWWSDFETLAGSSDEWVTAYVGSLLSEVDDDRALRAARDAWEALQTRRRWSKGWGYNRRVPADADSTLWTLRLAGRLNSGDTRRARHAWKFLSRHARSDGAIATYAEDGPIRLFTRLLRSVSFEGWCGPHLCVTAVAAGLPEFSGHAKALNYVRQAQHCDGSWIGYWWCDHEYTTSLVVEALAATGGTADKVAIDRAMEWTANRLTRKFSTVSTRARNESAFAVASCVRILAHTRDKRQLRALLETPLAQLYVTQNSDGSWSPSARLRIPPPGVTDPESYVGWVRDGKGGGSIQVDINKCFTTATVLSALHEVEKLG